MSRVVVVKIGSRVLMTPFGRLDLSCINHLAQEIAILFQRQIKCIVICSGAVACGSSRIEKINHSRLAKQTAAGIGQIDLMTAFAQAFRGIGLNIAQILLTPLVFAEQEARRSLQELLRFTLKHSIVPIINENDVIGLNSFGGNDFLAAEILILSKAKELFMLSTKGKSRFGVGGAASKIKVIKKLSREGISVRILDGKKQNVLTLSVEHAT